MREPFAQTSVYQWGIDRNTRIMIFCLNLTLQPGDDASAVTVDAEDATHKHYDFTVEIVKPVLGQPWLDQVVIRLSDDLPDVGDVLLRLTYRGTTSNRVRIGIGHVGGGPPDDPDAIPTPARSCVVSGQVTQGNSGLAGVHLTLSGSQSDETFTDTNGFYSFSVISFGNYTVTPARPFYVFAPRSFTFANLSDSRTDINWVAVRETFSVGGQVTDENNEGVDGIVVTLSDLTNDTMNTVTTKNGGNFSFGKVLAGFNYQLTFTSNIFEFPSETIDQLSANFTRTFKGTRRLYNIRGRTTNATGEPLAGVTVMLGSGQIVVTTDAMGDYAFEKLAAGFDYVITPSKSHYSFSPTTLTLGNLSNSQTVNFRGALVKYTIAGRVTDSSAHGLIGITVTLSGSETATNVTDRDGNYSFSATALGTYAIKPFIDQKYYTFAPVSRQFPILSQDQSANFSAQLSAIPNPFSVLEWDGYERTVDYGYFWPPYVDLGHFFWEFWAMPGNNAGATYLLSDGYGGAHSLLFGFGFYGSSESGRYQLFGDTFDGVEDVRHITFFSSDQGPAVGEWGHFAVGWDGQNIITYFDGVPVGKTPFLGPRQSPGTSGGGGRLLIGGSDHNNLIGRIAQVRGYEDINPREDPGTGGAETSFTPETIFGIGGSLLSYYFRPAPKIADLSFGYNGQTHVGVPRGTTAGVLYDCGSCLGPKFVNDPTAPNFPEGTAGVPVNVAAPAPVPPGARIFDSFGRPNSTYLFGAQGGLGSTEGGLAGAQVWQMGQDSSSRQPFGILNGVAVLLGNAASVAWVPTNSSTGNLMIQVDRRAGVWRSGIGTGISFRVKDEKNYFFAYTLGNSAKTQSLTVGYYLNGQRTDLVTGVSMPSEWTRLSVTTLNSGSLMIYAGDLVYSTNSSVLANASGAGLYNAARDLALANRWDNFAVFDVP